ncbi:MAG: HNH endonuclease [Chthoniobacterales bacterium]
MDLFSDQPEKKKPSRPAEYGTPEFWQQYSDYIKTPAWKKLRRQVKERAKGRCEQTPPAAFHPGPFEVHHVNYDRFTHELLADLVYLCRHCHDIADEKRKRETAARNAAAYEDEAARISAHKASFFRTKYGYDWELDYAADPETLEQEYSDWIESKGDPRYD